jgi:hypothetical protein
MTVRIDGHAEQVSRGVDKGAVGLEDSHVGSSTGCILSTMRRMPVFALIEDGSKPIWTPAANLPHLGG